MPIADLLAGMYGAYGVARRAARARPHRRGHRRAHLAARRDVVGVHAFQGTRWTVAGEVGRAQGNHHPSIAPYGLFHCRDGSVQIARGQRGPVAAVLRRRSGSTRRRPGLATNPERVAHRDAGRSTFIEAAFADWDAEPLLARLAEVGVPGRQGAHARRGLRAGTRPRSQGLLVEVEHADAGPAHAARAAAALLRPATAPR